MTQDTLEREEVDLAAMEQMLYEAKDPCSGWTPVTAKMKRGCSNVATRVILCPCGGGVAYICESCLAFVNRGGSWRRRLLGPPWLRFVGQCDHERDFEKCIINPI
jgi:hypothetical protein